jgi:hypothetical protein
MCQTKTNKLKTAANSIAMVSWVTYRRGDGVCLHTSLRFSLKCLTRGEATFTICTTAISEFFNNTKSGSYWEEGDPVLCQAPSWGFYTYSLCLHQAFSRPSLSSLNACNILSLKHSQNNRPLRPLWPQGPSISGTTQPWGITLQIN